MKKIIYTLLVISVSLASCSKWTETETMRDDLEKAAIEDLINKRDAAKWVAEDERTIENKKALEAYWAQLREYKQKAWLILVKQEGKYLWYTFGLMDLLGNL